MGKFKDLSGQIFGRLTVIKRIDDRYTSGGNLKVRYLCKCSCEDNKYIEVDAANLRNYHTNSCGCLSKDVCKKKYNIYDLTGEYGIGYTSKGEEFYFDIEDYDLIKDYCWYYGTRKYITAHTKDRYYLKMHQLITGVKNIDHINRKPFDNRKSNFRNSNMSENVSNGSLRKNNKTGIIGVEWRENRNKYMVRIEKNYNVIYLGYYSDFIDAVRVRLKAEKEYFGEFAPQRHLFEEYNL